MLSLTVSISTQEYKWVPVKGWGGGGGEGGGEVVKHLIALCCENWDKLWLDGPHGLSTDITYQ